VKCIEGLSNRLSIIIRRYTDQMKFAVYMAVLFITFFSHILLSLFVSSYILIVCCMLLFNCVNYVSLLLCLCILIVMYVQF
jgi:hypothetical protein